jgi:hypothetical protein
MLNTWLTWLGRISDVGTIHSDRRVRLKSYLIVPLKGNLSHYKSLNLVSAQQLIQELVVHNNL